MWPLWSSSSRTPPALSSCEVEEPDLSMELTGQLKYSLTDLEICCSKEETQVRRAMKDSPPAALEERLRNVYMKYAQLALDDIVTLLRSFDTDDPEFSKEKLSSDVQGIIHTELIVGHLGHRLKASLRELVPPKRSQWLANDLEGHLAAQRAFLRAALSWVQGTYSVLRFRAMSLPEDLSLGSLSISSIAGSTASGSVQQVLVFFGSPAAGASGMAQGLREAAAAFGCGSKAFILNGQTQAVAAGATSGAVIGGTGAGAAGLITGSVAGAMCGVVPAAFTLGLSIPLGAMAGGSAGLFAGAAAGGSAGLLGGGAAGYTAYVWRDALRSGASKAWQQVMHGATSSSCYVNARFVGGTGGTA